MSKRPAILIAAIFLAIPAGAPAQAGGQHRFAGRLTTGLDRVGSRPAGALALRAQLSDSFSSGALGAEPGRTLGTLPRVLAGGGEQDAAFDPQTRTVYVANSFDNTLSVVDARRCNARDTVGCGQTAPTVAAGNGPFFVGIDDATHTLYVADSNSDKVSVINAAT